MYSEIKNNLFKSKFHYQERKIKTVLLGNKYFVLKTSPNITVALTVRDQSNKTLKIINLFQVDIIKLDGTNASNINKSSSTFPSKTTLKTINHSQVDIMKLDE